MPAQMTVVLNDEQIRVMSRALDSFLWQRAPREERQQRPHDRTVARELLSVLRYGPLDLR